MSLLYVASILVGIGFVVVLLVALLRFSKRGSGGAGKALTAWAKSVKFSSQQLAAMRSLWHWYRTGKQPAADPLKLLSTADMADLLRKCALEFKPVKLRASNEEAARQRLGSELRRLGMDDMHVQVLVGMKFGQLGPAAEHLR